MDEPGKVVNPAFPVSVRAWEFGLARRVRPSRPASACPFSILRLDLMLTLGILSDFRGGVHLFIKTAICHRVSPEFKDKSEHI